MSETTKTTAAVRRGRSGCASWHMSRRAVSLALKTIYRMTESECLNFLVELRFGSWDTVRCPHCGSIGKHYRRQREKRWKCAACDKTFSPTSGTVFANRKLPLSDILANAMLWINSAGGQPALELKRNADTTYLTEFVLQHKLREGLARGFNVGLISGDLEMDGAHQSGWRSAEKRGKPQVTLPITKTTPLADVKSVMLTQTGKEKERAKGRKKARMDGVINPEFGNRLSKNRRFLISMRKRSPVRGRGATQTRIAIGINEDSPVVEQIMAKFIAMPESVLNTDGGPGYTKIGERYLAHHTVEHSVRMVGPNGENNNQAEELNGRYDRAEKGLYLNIEPKYLLEYGVEVAFRSDTRRLPNGLQMRIAVAVAMSVGPSAYWANYTHGRHRLVEHLFPANQAYPASGPKKGRHPISMQNGRPPR